MELRNLSRVLMVVLLAVAGNHVFAVPCLEQSVTFDQPDGSKISVVANGDEFYMRLESIDGYTLIKDPVTKWWSYALLSEDKKTYVSSGIRYTGGNFQATANTATKSVDGTASATPVLEKHISILPEAIEALVSQQKNSSALAKTTATSASAVLPQNTPVTGVIKGLTIYVDFSDAPATHTVDEVNRLLNKVGYTENGNNGSVRDYFYDVSNGKLDYSNIVLGVYRAINTTTLIRFKI